MKKLKKYLIVVLILTIFFSAIFNYNVSIADVGNFEDYDSGSSWDDDSWDSESSWNDWDDDDYSYSGTSYSSGGKFSISFNYNSYYYLYYCRSYSFK